MKINSERSVSRGVLAVFVGLFALFVCPPPCLSEDKIHVAFINPGISDINDPTGGFWLSVTAFMEAAAEDLNIDLEIIYSERDHLLMQRQAREIAERDTPPDYLLLVNEKLAAGDMLRVANKAGIKTFIMLNVFVDDQAVTFGNPREKYRHWIGTLIPDNHFAGYQIGKLLIDKALAAGATATNGQLQLAAIAGNRATQASVERVRGLLEAVAEYDNVELKQIFYAEWRKDKAKAQAQVFLQRYPEIGAVWAANDPMALGAIEAAESIGKRVGEEIFFGGLNWDEPGLAKTREGAMVTSVGGHFMTGGWALVLLHDYHRGKDFAETEGDVQLQHKIFGALHAGNIDDFVEKFGSRDWGKIDFTRFSKVFNPGMTRYEFGLDALLKQSADAPL